MEKYSVCARIEKLQVIKLLESAVNMALYFWVVLDPQGREP